jgi:hypothetical protein
MNRSRKAVNHAAVNDPRKTSQQKAPRALTMPMALIEGRRPSCATTGVLPLAPPSAPHAGIGAKAGFIEEKDLGSRGERLALERRETPALPLLDGPGVAQPCSCQMMLRGQFQFAQELADSLHAVADAPALPDQIPDDGPRPEGEVESVISNYKWNA